jgi:hypothetical protein
MVIAIIFFGYKPWDYIYGSAISFLFGVVLLTFKKPEEIIPLSLQIISNAGYLAFYVYVMVLDNNGKASGGVILLMGLIDVVLIVKKMIKVYNVLIRRVIIQYASFLSTVFCLIYSSGSFSLVLIAFIVNLAMVCVRCACYAARRSYDLPIWTIILQIGSYLFVVVSSVIQIRVFIYPLHSYGIFGISLVGCCDFLVVGDIILTKRRKRMDRKVLNSSLHVFRRYIPRLVDEHDRIYTVMNAHQIEQFKRNWSFLREIVEQPLSADRHYSDETFTTATSFFLALQTAEFCVMNRILDEILSEVLQRTRYNEYQIINERLNELKARLEEMKRDYRRIGMTDSEFTDNIRQVNRRVQHFSSILPVRAIEFQEIPVLPFQSEVVVPQTVNELEDPPPDYELHDPTLHASTKRLNDLND